MLLGAPVPAIVLQTLFEAVKHSDIKWRYGRVYPIIVRTTFHGIDHSSKRAEHDSNYGAILAIWDYLFGTMSAGGRPAKYGAPSVEGRDTLWGTCLAPFRQLKRWVARDPIPPIFS